MLGLSDSMLLIGLALAVCGASRNRPSEMYSGWMVACVAVGWKIWQVSNHLPGAGG